MFTAGPRPSSMPAVWMNTNKQKEKKKRKKKICSNLLSIYGLVCQRLTFDSRERTALSAVILCLWRHEHGRHAWQKCTLRHEPTIFCFTPTCVVAWGPVLKGRPLTTEATVFRDCMTFYGPKMTHIWYVSLYIVKLNMRVTYYGFAFLLLFVLLLLLLAYWSSLVIVFQRWNWFRQWK